ncbi:MAG TPA: hypothetical protein VGO40_11680 [Longimicrobium sp.]|jgi:hypothetical protein|nr:hypothetical protein [Longimicrobium sp.]
MPTRRHLAAAVLLLSAACRADSTAPDPGLAMGTTYTLRSIGGRPLPWVELAREPDTTWVIGGSYAFRADSTYTFSYDYRYRRSSEVTVQHYEDTGRYRAFGDSLQLSDWWDYGARRSGKAVIVHGRYDDWIYRR